MNYPTSDELDAAGMKSAFGPGRWYLFGPIPGETTGIRRDHHWVETDARGFMLTEKFVAGAVPWRGKWRVIPHGGDLRACIKETPSFDTWQEAAAFIKFLTAALGK